MFGLCSPEFSANRWKLLFFQHTAAMKDILLVVVFHLTHTVPSVSPLQVTEHLCRCAVSSLQRLRSGLLVDFAQRKSPTPGLRFHAPPVFSTCATPQTARIPCAPTLLDRDVAVRFRVHDGGFLGATGEISHGCTSSGGTKKYNGVIDPFRHQLWWKSR